LDQYLARTGGELGGAGGCIGRGADRRSGTGCLRKRAGHSCGPKTHERGAGAAHRVGVARNAHENGVHGGGKRGGVLQWTAPAEHTESGSSEGLLTIPAANLIMPELKQIARRIFHETLAAIDIPAAMQRKLRRHRTRVVCGGATTDLGQFDKLRVVAIGKAAHAMVEGLALVLAPFVRFEGVVSAPTSARKPVAGMKYFVAGHPLPNAESWKAAEEILALLKKCDEKTLVFFLLSGGGSALVELPLDSAQTLDDVQQTYRALVTCGAPIEAINTVRKHISAIKGGRLAAAAHEATKVTLAVSDGPVGTESALASGSTLPDPTTVADAKRILAEYRLHDRFPPSLRRWLDRGKMPETPKAEAGAFRNSHFFLLLGMDDLFHPAHHSCC